jgi:hypothetical protein
VTCGMEIDDRHTNSILNIAHNSASKIMEISETFKFEVGRICT